MTLAMRSRAPKKSIGQAHLGVMIHSSSYRSRSRGYQGEMALLLLVGGPIKGDRSEEAVAFNRASVCVH